jgi:hypothetical protein
MSRIGADSAAMDIYIAIYIRRAQYARHCIRHSESRMQVVMHSSQPMNRSVNKSNADASFYAWMLCRNLAFCASGVSVSCLRRTVLLPLSRRMSSQEGAAAAVALGSCAMNTASVKPVPEGFSCVSEGSASIIHETGHVFYNPAQVQNRDLSIACLNVFSKIYRLEKEARAAKRSSRHAADATAAIASSPVVASGNVAPEETAVEYKGLRILEGLSLSYF